MFWCYVNSILWCISGCCCCCFLFLANKSFPQQRLSQADDRASIGIISARARVNAYHLCVCHAVCVCVNMSKLSNNSYAEIDDMKRVLGRTINNSKTARLDTFKFKSNSIIFNIGVCNCVWERSAALLNWVNEWLLLFCRRHVLMSALADCHRQEFFVILDFHSIRVEIHNN